MTLAETYSLHGYDAVPLVTVVGIHVRGLMLGLPALTLVSADGELNTAVQAEGLWRIRIRLRPEGREQ